MRQTNIIGMTMCSGIGCNSEAKRCAMCGEVKPLDDYHRMGKGKRHCYCKPCLLSRPRNRKKVCRTDGNLRRRYGLSVQQRDEMLTAQGGVCAICGTIPKRVCVDHCHDTGSVRGILCHPCNVKLAAIDDRQFHESALRYLGKAQC